VFHFVVDSAEKESGQGFVSKLLVHETTKPITQYHMPESPV